MTENTAIFSKTINGYDTHEVNNYIQILSGAYQTAYDEFGVLKASYDSLLEKYEKANAYGDGTEEPQAAGIVKVLTDAQIVARKIVEVAREEAEQIRAEANRVLAGARLMKEGASAEQTKEGANAEQSKEGAEDTAGAEDAANAEDTAIAGGGI